MRTEIRNLQGESGVLDSFFHTNASQTTQVRVESTKFCSLACFVPFSGKSSKCELSLLFWDFSQNHWFRPKQTLPQHLAHYVLPWPAYVYFVLVRRIGLVWMLSESCMVFC
jgi:hypothetical protein